MSVHSKNNRDNVFHSLDQLPEAKRKICVLLEHRPNGLTRHEIAAALVMPLSTVCGRVTELEESGWVVSTAETRQTPHGKPATVVCLAHRTKPVQRELNFV